MSYKRAYSSTEGRLLGSAELQRYLNMGKASATNLAKEAGAVIKIGGRVLYDRTKIDAYLDTLPEAR